MKPFDNNSKRLQQKANNITTTNTNNLNRNINLTNQRKPAILNNNQARRNLNNHHQLPDLSWDEIESRDADSIRSDSDSTFNNNKKHSSPTNKPRLYTFYDYINKNKAQPLEQQLGRSNDNQLQTSLQPAELDNSSQRPLPEHYYITMPISSGFGGYTNTTRRKAPPKPEKVLAVTPVRKPVKFQPLYRVNSDDDLPSQRTIIVEDEPEEEVVHVVHRQRPKPKEKIIYVEEEQSPPPTQTKNIIYVDPPATSATYVYSAKAAPPPPPTTQVVYTQPPQPQPPATQVIYQQQPPQQIVYATAPQPRAQTVLFNEAPQVQYVLQEQPSYATSQYATSQYAAPQYAYIDASPASNVLYYNDPMSNLVTTVPATNIIYR